jgi:streptomycin 6-kinase
MDTYARELPLEFREHFAETFGAGAVEWLDALPELLRRWEQRWRLQLQPPYQLSYGYVAPATRDDGARVVLKARFPNGEARNEIEALRAFGGDAAVHLLDADPDGCMMLLERIEPGTMLKEVADDAQATAIAARIMTALHRPPPAGHTFPSVQQWWAKAAGDIRRRYEGGCGPLPEGLVRRAGATFDSEPEERAVLLHGDVHHENILLDERRGWLIIDPQGVVGDRAYEAGTFVRNHLLHRADAPAALARRVDVLAKELTMERRRIIEWSLAHNVMSACWSLESHGTGWEGAIAVARMLAALDAAAG